MLVFAASGQATNQSKTSAPFDGTFGAPLAKPWRCDYMHLIRSQSSDQALKLAKLGNAQNMRKGPRQRVPSKARGSQPQPICHVRINGSAPRWGCATFLQFTAANVLERRRTLEAIPEIWRDALLAYDSNKRPVCPVTGRLLNDWPRATAPSFNQLLRAQAVGLRTGPISSTIAFDFDGIKSWKTFRHLFGGQPWHVLPDSSNGPAAGMLGGKWHSLLPQSIITS
jgi:hypothetical protein